MKMQWNAIFAYTYLYNPILRTPNYFSHLHIALNLTANTLLWGRFLGRWRKIYSTYTELVWSGGMSHSPIFNHQLTSASSNLLFYVQHKMHSRNVSAYLHQVLQYAGNSLGTGLKFWACFCERSLRPWKMKNMAQWTTHIDLYPIFWRMYAQGKRQMAHGAKDDTLLPPHQAIVTLLISSTNIDFMRQKGDR